MKISPDGSSFSTSGDVDSLTSHDNNGSAGVQRAPSDETSYQKQMLAKMDQITAKLFEECTGKESELARCVVELVQANERLTAANERLTAQVNDLSLQFARHDGTADLASNRPSKNLTRQMKNREDSLLIVLLGILFFISLYGWAYG
jgi:hypothetical protein